MFSTHARISDYRTVIGRPQRGMRPANKKVSRLVDQVRQRAARLASTGTTQFAESVQQCRRRIRNLDAANRVENVVESFALTTEALRRATGLVYYDVQLAGGFALAAGTIAEIQTGEGKTIVTALPATLYGWTGKGVHVATTNDYLSERDYHALLPVFELLQISVGLLRPQTPLTEKIKAYACDVTYGPGYEFGFDFLRDQLALRSQQQQRLGAQFLGRLQGLDDQHAATMQRGQFMAIVDEADSVLIDEANTPLVLSGGNAAAGTAPEIYVFAREIASHLEQSVDFQLDPIGQTVQLTDQGLQTVQASSHQRPAGPLARPLTEMVEHALQAEFVFKRDVHYAIQNDQILIVDQNTGRIHEERKWSRGLHQAVETKEGVTISPENNTHARITRQRFVQLYQRVAGLTGTVAGSEHEFHEFYNLPVVQIDTHRPCRRQVLPHRFFSQFDRKAKAIAHDVSERIRSGQPVLIGTRTIDESQRLARYLHQANVQHQTLNGLQDESEASIIARAGASGSVTVATNLAGRGTDIQPDSLALAAGGLHVIATEVHANRRVDRQLAGRSARQGDPGSCQFYSAADDDLIAMRAPTLARQMVASAGQAGECHS